MIAKEPVPGRVKTRLCPPCSPVEAAEIAAASLADTLATAVASGAERVVLALDGRPGPWCPPGVVLARQGGGGLDERLITAWSAVRAPALQIGMDTPQVTAEDLDGAMARLDAAGVDAVLGEARDGGWWAIGLRNPVLARAVLLEVPTSRGDTGARQRARLLSLGLRLAELPVLRDLDTWADALSLAATTPRSKTAEAVHRAALRHRIERRRATVSKVHGHYA